MCLKSPVAELALLQGDKLEPTAWMLDVSMFFTITSFPIPAIFWRSSSETLMRHRNPIFDVGLGITPPRVITIDTLHALFLGVFMGWCKCALWMMIESGVWGRHSTIDETISFACAAIRHDLDVFYKRRHQLDPKEVLDSEWNRPLCMSSLM